jgi:hypothetical protein
LGYWPTPTPGTSTSGEKSRAMRHSPTPANPAGWINLLREDGRDVARAMEHAHQLDPVGNLPIEDQVLGKAPDREHPQAGEPGGLEGADRSHPVVTNSASAVRSAASRNRSATAGQRS